MGENTMELLDGENLSIEKLLSIAEGKKTVSLPEEKVKQIRDMRTKLEKQLKDFPEIKIYGTNKLHGDLKHVDVDIETLKTYQEKYVKAHNCGTGMAVPIEVVRAMMVIRLNSFVKGLSGMRWETVSLLIEMINKKVTPWVMEEGSVGASGDLVPLAMIAAVMIGLPEAKAYHKGELMPAQEALKAAELDPIVLGAKEAMGLTNGSNFIAAFAAFALRDAESLLDHSLMTAALSLEAIRGEKDAFSVLINKERAHRGQKTVAAQMRELIEGSRRMSPEAQLHGFDKQADVELLEQLHDADGLSEAQRKLIDKMIKEKRGEVRVQDRYSFRAVPPVHGSVMEAIEKLREVLETELNSATDNPLFDEVQVSEVEETLTPEIRQRLKKEKVDTILKAYSGANFHGQPLAVVIDYVKIGLTSLGLISDKRSFSLLSKALSYGLPPDLALDTSKADGGLMIVQYAGAARAAENRVLSTPSSIMSISTAANQEDFVSMGSNGVIHLRKVVDNLRVVLACELLCALRALQLTKNHLPSELNQLGKITSEIYKYLSDDEQLGDGEEKLVDHYLRTDMEKAMKIIDNRKLLEFFPMVELQDENNHTDQ